MKPCQEVSWLGSATCDASVTSGWHEWHSPTLPSPDEKGQSESRQSGWPSAIHVYAFCALPPSHALSIVSHEISCSTESEAADDESL